MRSFKRLLGLGLLVGSAHAGWEGNELNWLAHEASERPPREARSHPPPERGEKIQASGNFVAPRLAGAREAGLMGAVRQGDVKAVRAALDAGVNPNLSEPGRAAPLLVAVRADQADIVLALLERGAFADFKGAGETPLARAVKNGNTILVRALLAAGADPDRRGDDGDTALHAAVRGGRSGLIAVIARARPDFRLFDREGLTPLGLAASIGQTAAAQALIDAGAPLELGDRKWHPPLWWAFSVGDFEMARLLLKNGAKPGGMPVETLN